MASRMEQLLEALLNGNTVDFVPQSRNEALLLAICQNGGASGGTGGGGGSAEYSLLETVNITEAVNSIAVDLGGTYNELWLFFDMVKSDANAQLAIGVNTSDWYSGLVFGSNNGALTTAGVYYAVHLKRLLGANLICREDTSHATYGFKTQNGPVNRRYADDNTNGISSLYICTMSPTTANYTAGTIKIWGC